MEPNTYMVAGQTFELKHYGVKGMKWGHRKAREEYKKLDKAKGEYRHAKKAYNRSFNYATSQAKGFSPSRAKRAENDAAWDDARRDAKRVNDTKKVYKAQKKAVRQNAPVTAKLERGGKAVGKGLAVVGGMYVYDQMYFGGAGTKITKAAASKAAKVGKAAVSKAYNSLMDSKFQYSVLDAAGNVLRRYN